jgi:hypothetical protein
MEKKETGLSALQESVHFQQTDATSRLIKKTVTLPQAIAIAIVSVMVVQFLGGLRDAEIADLRRELEAVKETAAAMEEVNVVLSERLVQSSDFLGPVQ